MPWTLLFSFLSMIPGAVGKYYDTKSQISLKELDNQLAIEQEKAKIIAQGIISQTELGVEQLKSTSMGFKEAFYALLLAPILITCINPDHGKLIFDSLNIVPEWYIIFVTTIGFAVWGITSDKVASVVQARRDYKIQMQKMKIDRKAFYDALRATKGSVTPDDVKENEAVFNKLDSEQS